MYVSERILIFAHKNQKKERNMKKLVMSLMMLLPLTVSAEEFEGYTIYEKVQIGEFFYNLLPAYQWAELTRKGKYSGDVVIPESVVYNDTVYTVRTFGRGAFRDCRELTSVTIPKSVVSIDAEAFTGCIRLTSVTIPDNVISLGSQVFQNCTNLTSVTIGSGVTSMGSGVFWDCDNLAEITIPDNVTELGNSVFYGCNKLSSVTLGKGVKIITHGCFSNCPSLTYIPYGENITEIESEAFQFCESLVNIDIPSGVTKIGLAAFHGCKNLSTVNIPEGVTTLGGSLFSNCISLKSVVLPDDVTKLGTYVFSNCSSMTTAVIPNSVTVIGEGLFASCKSLKDVYCYANTVPESDGNDYEAFSDFSNVGNATLHVPAGSLDQYKTTEPWKRFGSIVALTDTDPSPTGITAAERTREANIQYYDLRGHKVHHPQKGLYIGNGRKVVIK